MRADLVQARAKAGCVAPQRGRGGARRRGLLLEGGQAPGQRQHGVLQRQHHDAAGLRASLRGRLQQRRRGSGCCCWGKPWMEPSALPNGRMALHVPKLTRAKVVVGRTGQHDMDGQRLHVECHFLFVHPCLQPG
jgi:hypothetical protein